MVQQMDYWGGAHANTLYEMQLQQKVQLRLAELRERADVLAKQTGVVPMGFFAFEKANPTPGERNSIAPFLLGIGAVIAAAIIFSPTLPVMLTAMAGGVVLGFLMPEDETARLDRALTRYDSYLMQTEASAYQQVQSRGVKQEYTGPVHQTNHAETILAERAEASAAERSI